MVSVHRQTRQEGDRETRVVRWRWASGEVDERVTTTFRVATEDGGETYAPGESRTVDSVDLPGRLLRARIPSRAWARAGVVPAPGRAARAFRARLVEIGTSLRTLAGVRGRGDYARSGGVVTNLEFDTTLGFVRLGLVEEVPALLERALQSARHLVDHDLEPVSGLPFRHGREPRRAPPEPGHAWLQGLLLTACVAADDDLLRAAGGIARGLAGQRPRRAEGPSDRLRNTAWPLLELECWLRYADDPKCAAAADALAVELLERWDPHARAVRFGEGERERGGYTDRLWLTGGILVPALRAHLARRRSAELRRVCEALERRIRRLVLAGRAGIPIRCTVRDGAVVDVLRLTGASEGSMVLEGLTPRNVARALHRRQVQRGLTDVPAWDDRDLATAFSKMARCTWVLR